MAQGQCRSGVQTIPKGLERTGAVPKLLPRVVAGVDLRATPCHHPSMPNPGKRTARVKLTIARRAIDGFKPADKPWIAWDDRLTGYGVLVHPSGVKSFIVNYRLGSGGRTAPNKRLVIGRCDRMAPEAARREAHRAARHGRGRRRPGGGAREKQTYCRRSDRPSSST